MEQKITLEQRVDSLENKMGSLEQKLDKLTEAFYEFTVFVKQQFERQEKILESMSSDIHDLKEGQKQSNIRLNHIEGTLSGIQQAFWFKSF